MGTKSGGPVAGCWAMMKHLGREGYREIAREVMHTSGRIRSGIAEIESLEIIGNPLMSVLAFTSRQGNIFNIGDALQKKGWHLDRLQFPDALHLTVSRLNVGMEEEFLRDLENHPEDYKRWLYQGDNATDRPANLGYFIGYEIADLYYQNAANKQKAMQDLLNIGKYKKIFRSSNFENEDCEQSPFH
jgi:hypothetical protein